MTGHHPWPPPSWKGKKYLAAGSAPAFQFEGNTPMTPPPKERERDDFEFVRDALVTPPEYVGDALGALARLWRTIEQQQARIEELLAHPHRCDDCPGGPDQTARAERAEARIEELEAALWRIDAIEHSQATAWDDLTAIADIVDQVLHPSTKGTPEQ